MDDANTTVVKKIIRFSLCFGFGILICNLVIPVCFAGGCLPPRPITDSPVVAPTPPVITPPPIVAPPPVITPLPIVALPPVIVPSPVITSPVMPVSVPAISSDPKKSDADVAGMIAKTHQNNVGQNNSPHGSAPVVGSINPGSEAENSSKDLGIHSMVAPHAEEHSVIQATSSQVSLASGTVNTVDLHGDKLIHLGVDDKKIDVKPSTESGKVLMSADTAKKVLDGLVSTTGAPEAEMMSIGKSGEVVLHTVEDLAKLTVAPVITPAPKVVEIDKDKNPKGFDKDLGGNKDEGNRNNGNENNGNKDNGHGDHGNKDFDEKDRGGDGVGRNSGSGENRNIGNIIMPPEAPTIVPTITPTTTPKITPITSPATIQAVTPTTTPEITPIITPKTVPTTTPTFTLTPTTVTPTTIPTTSPTITPTTVGGSNSNTGTTINNGINFNSTTTDATLTGNGLITLNAKDASADSFVSDKPTFAAIEKENHNSIVIGQVVQKTGNVVEVDGDGGSHVLLPGDNVHLGGRFIFQGGVGGLDFRSFTGEVTHVGQ
ncbi:MAG TPA: hypothetical protein VGV92_09740 [Gammaproteobacteria bacterium]|nr:hypothetical protein [Gammaproteobacteria bacterium]